MKNAQKLITKYYRNYFARIIFNRFAKQQKRV